MPVYNENALATRASTRSKSALAASTRSNALQVRKNVTGFTIREDVASLLPEKESLKKPSSSVKEKDDGMLGQRMTMLERKLEKNEQSNKQKLKDVDDRLTSLNTHLLYMLSKPSVSTEGPGTPARDLHLGQDHSQDTRSPPVPALRKKLEQAADWERSMIADMSVGEGNTSLYLGEVEDGSKVEDQLQDLQQTLAKQQESIDTLITQNQKQAEQIASLLAALGAQKVLTDTVAQARLDISELQGRLIDLEGRVEGVEEGIEVGDASMLIERCPLSPSQSPISSGNKRKCAEGVDGVSPKRMAINTGDA